MRSMHPIAQPLTRTTRGLLVLLACFAASCTSYRNVLMTQAPTRIQENESVRVTTMAGEEFVFRVASIDESSISGPERTFPYSELVMIERSEIDVMDSLFMYLLAGLALLLL